MKTLVKGLLFILSSVAVAAETVPTDIQQPGTQPGEVTGLESPDKCDNCHGGYNAAVEPAHNWRGSMMAHAGRDPIFWATLAVAEQDFDGAGDVQGVVTDVSSADSVNALADKVYELHGVCHLLFNNAGVAAPSANVWETTANDWTWVHGVNVHGVMHGIRAFVPRMLARQSRPRSRILSTRRSTPGSCSLGSRKRPIGSSPVSISYKTTAVA